MRALRTPHVEIDSKNPIKPGISENRAPRTSQDARRVEIDSRNAIESRLPEWGKTRRAKWWTIAGELTPNQLHCATAPDGLDRQWKDGAFERIAAENRRALQKAEEAEIEANGYFTDPNCKEVICPDGVRCFITRFRAQRPRHMAVAPLPTDLSIPEFLLRRHA
jgi:hypothetical protein